MCFWACCFSLGPANAAKGSATSTATSTSCFMRSLFLLREELVWVPLLRRRLLYRRLRSICARFDRWFLGRRFRCRLGSNRLCSRFARDLLGRWLLCCRRRHWSGRRGRWLLHDRLR